MSVFDPYYDWLAIEPYEQPADHYRLLGLARFETDAARIAVAADERMAHVRSFQTGPRGMFTQKLLNEIAVARRCLLDAATKARYDAELASRMNLHAGQRPTPESVAVAPPAPPQPEAAWTGPPRPTIRSPSASLRRAKPHTWLWLLIAAAVFMIGGIEWMVSQGARRTSDGKAVAKKTMSPAPATVNLPAAKVAKSAVISPHLTGEFEFVPSAAKLTGELKSSEVAGRQALSGWSSPADQASWQFRVSTPGFFRAEVTYALSNASDAAAIELRIDQRGRKISLRESGNAGQFITDEVTVAVPASGLHTLAIHAAGSGMEGLAIAAIRLMPNQRDSSP